MPGLLTKKWKCKQMVSVTERRERSVIKLSLWLTYSTYSNAREKRKKTTGKKIYVCQLHNKRAIWIKDTVITSSNFNATERHSHRQPLQLTYNAPNTNTSEPVRERLTIAGPRCDCKLRQTIDNSGSALPFSSNQTVSKYPNTLADTFWLDLGYSVPNTRSGRNIRGGKKTHE